MPERDIRENLNMLSWEWGTSFAWPRAHIVQDMSDTHAPLCSHEVHIVPSFPSPPLCLSRPFLLKQLKPVDVPNGPDVGEQQTNKNNNNKKPSFNKAHPKASAGESFSNWAQDRVIWEEGASSQGHFLMND